MAVSEIFKRYLLPLEVNVQTKCMDLSRKRDSTRGSSIPLDSFGTAGVNFWVDPRAARY